MGKRDKVVLMTKVCTHGRNKQVAMQMLEQSLRRFQTDHLDVWQIHEVIYDDDPAFIFRQDGPIEALEQAKRQGKVRFVGFTGHKAPAIHLHMLSQSFPFDTVQTPLNRFDATYHSFETNVLPEVIKQGMAAFGMKSLGGSGKMVAKGAVTVDEALGYAMSLPVATTISSMDSIDILRQNVAIVSGFHPFSPVAMHDLRARCQADAADGRYEFLKTTKKYDGDVGREQHGYPSTAELPA